VASDRALQTDLPGPAAAAPPATRDLFPAIDAPVNAPAEAVREPSKAGVGTVASLPAEDLTSVVASAGLEWVQTTHAEPIAEEITPVAARPRRPRKPKERVIAEPLQQVETQPGDNDPA
jgi:hypothetical protein